MKQQFLKLFFYTNEEINILKNEHNLFSGFLLPRPSKYYLIFTGYSFLWLLLSLVFIFSLLLKVFFNNTVWSRVLLWIRKHIWLNTFNLVSWFSVFLEIKYQAKHSHKTFQLYCFLSSRMICYLLKWKTQHCNESKDFCSNYILLWSQGKQDNRNKTSDENCWNSFNQMTFISEDLSCSSWNVMCINILWLFVQKQTNTIYRKIHSFLLLYTEVATNQVLDFAIGKKLSNI